MTKGYYFISQIENKGNPLNPPKSSNKTLQTHFATSFPKYITKLEATFTSTGGELSAPLDSDVRIIVPSGAIPAGITQSVFFGVFLDETTLLRDIPETPDRTLISPMIECGPHDVHLLKAVEIIVPHCLDLSKAEKKWIAVYRCGQFPARGDGSYFLLHLSLRGYAYHGAPKFFGCKRILKFGGYTRKVQGCVVS